MATTCMAGQVPGIVARQTHLRYLLIALDSVHEQEGWLLVAGVLHIPQLLLLSRAGRCSAAPRRADDLPGAQASCQSQLRLQ